MLAMKIFCLYAMLLFIFFSSVALAQKKAYNGRVIDEKTNEPLEFVSVYITNTTIGTITNEKGGFSLMLDPGNYEVVVSMVGYGPIVHPIEIKSQESAMAPTLFKIAQKSYVLDTVSVLAKRDASWYSNLRSFKEYFLGKSSMAQKCKLLNPDALITVFDIEKQTLTVTAKEPLLIENPELGYKIKFLLIAFVMNKEARYSSYLGYPHFEACMVMKRKGRNGRKNVWRHFGDPPCISYVRCGIKSCSRKDSVLPGRWKVLVFLLREFRQMESQNLLSRRNMKMFQTVNIFLFRTTRQNWNSREIYTSHICVKWKILSMFIPQPLPI